MLHYIMIMLREKGMLLYSAKISEKFKQLQPELVSGLMVALNDFSQMIKIGELSTFISHNFKVVISAKGKISLALVIDLEDNEESWKKCSLDIANAFQLNYHLDEASGIIDTSKFKDFKSILNQILAKYSWKNVLDIKHTLGAMNLLLFFDTRDFTYYRFTTESLMQQKEEEEDLLNKALEITSEEMPEVKTTEKATMLYIIREGVFGAIARINQGVKEKEYLRMQRTIAFIVRNFSTRFFLNQRLHNAAKAIFGGETINELLIYEGKTIPEIFRDAPEPFKILESYRRLLLRGLLVQME